MDFRHYKFALGISKLARNNTNNMLHWCLLNDNKKSERPVVHVVSKAYTFTCSPAKGKKSMSKQRNHLAHSCPG